MALYIQIRKIEDTKDLAKFSYSSDSVNFGYVMLNKQTGEVTQVAASPDDADGRYFVRTAAKLRNEWQSGRIPDVTQWAS